jgi:hypothetical protein
MPGGYKNIKHTDGKSFTSGNQPTHNGRKKGSRAWKDVLSDLMSEDGYLSFKNVEEVGEDGRPTGNVFKTARVKTATQEMIMMAAIRQAMKGKIDAMKMIMDRMDGRPTMTLAGDKDSPLFPTEIKIQIEGKNSDPVTDEDDIQDIVFKED